MKGDDPMYSFGRALCDYLYLNIVEIDIAIQSAIKAAFPEKGFEANRGYLERLMGRDEAIWADFLSRIDDKDLKTVLEALRDGNEPNWELLTPGPYDIARSLPRLRRAELSQLHDYMKIRGVDPLGTGEVGAL